MRKWLRAAAWLVVSLLVLVAGVFAVAWAKTEADLARTYAVDDPPLRLRGDAAERARGEHLYTVAGCVECHGQGGRGMVFIDGGPVAYVVAPNLTPAALAGRYDADAIAAAIRHGVGPDGRALRVMPSTDFMNLSDEDTAALVAYLQALPPLQNNPGTTEIRPLGRLLTLMGKFHLTPAADIDHSPRTRSAPPEGPTAEYGAYLAQVCTGCHGMAWTGQRVPGTPPELPPAPNLTAHATGLQDWSEADFVRVLREGKRPDGGDVHPFMPWRSYGRMSDVEVQALWRHLQGLPATAGQVRQPPA
ncbi:c-type cytochrome [Arenimonas donghaensis]|uniref:c-type cytochrome n=1 Tax=Arenimonas donghaensis TaxID=375061 RepID=UPI000556E188|nr:c-type cytochrome [Arenimonas donghaensis]